MVDGDVFCISIGKRKRGSVIIDNNQPFIIFLSEYVKFRFSYSDAHAAATASVAQILPVILMPFLGVFVDHHGKRTWLSKFYHI